MQPIADSHDIIVISTREREGGGVTLIIVSLSTWASKGRAINL